MRPIDADKLKIRLETYEYTNASKMAERGGNEVLHYFMPKVIDDEPTFKHEARWKEVEPRELICTNCGGYAPMNYMHEHYVETAFCPHCGAMNRGKEDDTYCSECGSILDGE